MEEDSLARIGERYAEEADQLEDLVAACRERRRQALMRGQSAEAMRQERLIELHTRQRGDLIQLSHWLRHYYDHGAEENPMGEQHNILKEETYENHRSGAA